MEFEAAAIGRGCRAPPGFETTVGVISKNARRSVRKSAWSAMLERVEKICEILLDAFIIVCVKKTRSP